jgi:thymidylate kinase
VRGKPTLRQLQALLYNSPMLHLYRTYHPFEARIRRWLRELLWGLGVINKRYLHAAIPLRRIPATGGLLIALMGCDGSGKSTQMKAVIKWLSWKIDVVPVYFGSGDGPSSLIRKPFNVMARVVRDLPGFKSNRKSLKTMTEDRISVDSSQDPMLRKIARAPWALVLAYEKCNKIRKATKARNRGMIVVCDRYPQNQIMGFNDGPLISHWRNHRLWFLRKLAQWESAPYRWAEDNPPDIVLKLDVTPEVALLRKPDADIEEYQRRVAAIKSFKYPSKTEVVLLDAEEPLELVLLKAKMAIWEAI